MPDFDETFKPELWNKLLLEVKSVQERRIVLRTKLGEETTNENRSVTKI